MTKLYADDYELREIFEELRKIHQTQGEDMAAIDDLNTAVTNLQTEQVAVATAVTDLVAAVAASSAANDPAIEAAVSNINAVTASLTTDAASDPGPQASPTGA